MTTTTTTTSRRLAFYKHLASYALANEVDKFLSTRDHGRFDQVDVQLNIAVAEGKE